MTSDLVITLAIALVALGLFIWGRFRADVVGLVVMTALIVSGVLTPQEGISGFANEATVTVAAMFVLSAALARTGAVDTLGHWVARIGGGSEYRLLAVSLGLVIPLSAFLNNTPVVVVMVPLVLGLSRTHGVHASRLLMPISFASQLGGTLTLIGTSTNLLVAGLALELGVPRIGLFDVTPAAAILTLVGVVYLLTVGWRLTPLRRSGDEDLFTRYELRDYMTGLAIEDGSPLGGRTLRETRFGSKYGLAVLAIEREGVRIFSPGPDTPLHVGDLVIASGSAADIARVEEAAGVRIAPPERGFPDPGEGKKEGGTQAIRLAELMVPPRSHLGGRTLRELHFSSRYRLQVLGIRRHGQSIHERLRDIRLQTGDLLLVQGTNDDLNQVHRHRDLALLGVVQPPARRRRKMGLAVGILAGVVLLAALDVLPILVAALLGVVAVFVTGCVTAEEASEDVDWMVVLLLGAILPLGLAMQKTGAAGLVAGWLVSATAPLGPVGVLAAFYLMTSLLTEVISNNAAAVVFVPIAVATASSLDLSPLPFVVAVMIAASNSFMTPIGYQTNTFVYGPGGYRFGDFLRVGGPLNFLLVAAAAFVIPLFFPF